MQTLTDPELSADPAPAEPPIRLGLSGKLLILTVVFVMLAEVLIYVPSIANFRLTWLNDRLASAHTAALVLDAAPSGMVPESLAKQILDSIGARAVAMKMGQQRRLLATSNLPSEVQQEVDARDMGVWPAIVEAFRTLLFDRDNDIIRAIGPAPMGGEFVEIVIDEAPLRRAMWRYSRNVLMISLLISAISAALVYFSLHYLFVRPLHRITANMMAFRADPENPARIIAASRRRDEIGIAERELAGMQRDLASMLQQKTRLAALGLAVSKINHDLRNLLASAQLFSDRLVKLPDPQVQRFAPKLMQALERAIAFCQSTLSYGRAQEPAPDRRTVMLRDLVDEVRDTIGLVAGIDHRLGRGGRARPDRRCRSRAVAARPGQPRPQCAPGAGDAGAQRPRPRPDPHLRAARGRRHRHRGGRHRPRLLGTRARPSVRGVPGLDPRRRLRPRPGHRCRAGARPWRRDRPDGRHRRRHLPHQDPGPADRASSPPQRARQRVTLWAGLRACGP